MRLTLRRADEVEKPLIDQLPPYVYFTATAKNLAEHLWAGRPASELALDVPRILEPAARCGEFACARDEPHSLGA